MYYIIVSQTKVRLEIEILSYIVQSARERHTSSEGERNKYCRAFDFFLRRSRTADPCILQVCFFLKNTHPHFLSF